MGFCNFLRYTVYATIRRNCEKHKLATIEAHSFAAENYFSVINTYNIQLLANFMRVL